MQFKGARVLNKNANSLSALLLVRPELGAQDYKDVADYFKNREQATLDTLDQSGGQADEGYSDHLEETRKN